MKGHAGQCTEIRKKICSFIQDSFAFAGHFSVPLFFYSGQELVHLHRPAQLPIPLLCFSERLAKITLLQISFGLPWVMISIHAIQFLIEIINWTSPLLAGNLFQVLAYKKKGGKRFSDQAICGKL